MIKDFDDGRPLLKYDDWTTLKNIDLNNNGKTGDGLVPVESNIREVYFETVISRNAGDPDDQTEKGAAFVEDVTFLSAFIACDFGNSDYGMSVRSDIHSPHNVYLRCRMHDNREAGIDVQQSLDRKKFVGCLIDGNKFGIDTGQSTEFAPLTLNTSIMGGTMIQSNDGPGIILRGEAAE